MEKNTFTRRAFIGSGLAATTAAGTARGKSSPSQDQLEPSKVLNYKPGMKYRRLENKCMASDDKIFSRIFK
jgi:hypothetical protein